MSGAATEQGDSLNIAPTVQGAARMEGGNEAPLLNMRDPIVHEFFILTSLTYARLLCPSARRLIEFLLLVKALCFLFILLYLHFLARQPTSCLEEVRQIWPRHGILHIEVVNDVQPEVPYSSRVAAAAPPPSSHAVYTCDSRSIQYTSAYFEHILPESPPLNRYPTDFRNRW
ncbi:unnamed protein product [Soboliphyme baturini]|uniref:Uncharacterized protein n=1 Tax=Soboliphyme baturini TaxID=241478 RepID=A0A183IEX1_9BILA|nr:unnamed protein product [Soboliphyme baturini]